MSADRHLLAWRNGRSVAACGDDVTGDGPVLCEDAQGVRCVKCLALLDDKRAAADRRVMDAYLKLDDKDRTACGCMCLTMRRVFGPGVICAACDRDIAEYVRDKGGTYGPGV